MATWPPVERGLVRRIAQHFRLETGRNRMDLSVVLILQTAAADGQHALRHSQNLLRSRLLSHLQRHLRRLLRTVGAPTALFRL